MNLRFEIVPDRPDSIPDLTVRVRGERDAARGIVQQAMIDALEVGRKEAEAEAPRGPILERDSGRISDSIQVTYQRQALAGGAGGGSYYEGKLFADSRIAPHLRYVMEGTADQGRGLITPSRGNVLALQKEGETVRFRPWVHGQRANTRWWDDAHRAVEASLDAGINI